MYFQVRQFPFYLTFWNQNKSLLVKILAPWVNLSLEQSHCYFTRLNLKKTGPLQFCLPALLKIHKNHTQKEFLKSCEGFLRAALTVHGHPGPVWKIAKMALFDPCMEFEKFLGQMTLFEVLLKCHSLTLCKKYLRFCRAPSKCLSERINCIISTIPHRISKILIVYGSFEFLAMLEGKIREAPFF